MEEEEKREKCIKRLELCHYLQCIYVKYIITEILYQYIYHHQLIPPSYCPDPSALFLFYLIANWHWFFLTHFTVQCPFKDKNSQILLKRFFESRKNSLTLTCFIIYTFYGLLQIFLTLTSRFNLISHGDYG